MKRSWNFNKNIVLKAFFTLTFLSSCNNEHSIIEQSHLAGSWFAKQPQELKYQLEEMDKKAHKKFAMQADGKKIRALIVPHAGYVYSGSIASAAFRLLQPNAIKRVIILAPSHFIAFNGVALPSFNKYALPTGQIQLDTKAINELQKNINFHFNDSAFNPEHSAEIQMPLIHFYLPQAHIIPLIIGNLLPEAINDVVKALLPLINQQTVVIVSSDLTHYGAPFSYTPFAENILLNVRQLDSKILDAIQENDNALYQNLLYETQATICGRVPIAILLKLLQYNAFGNSITRLVAYGSSAEKEENSDRLVSYGSLIVTQETENNSLNMQEKNSLLRYARDILTNSFKKTINNDLLKPIVTPELKKLKGAFVTLYTIKNGKRTLRGCIGRINAIMPLYQVVADMTLASAFHDSRFTPVKEEELDQLLIEISVLTPPHPVKSYKDIILNKHGIILTLDSSSALFLPRVPKEFGMSFEQTLAELSKKAGLKENDWKSPKAQFQVFESLDFEEEDINLVR